MVSDDRVFREFFSGLLKIGDGLGEDILFVINPAQGIGDAGVTIFADQTNGYETYGAGRFVYASMPGEDGKTILDFNKAYNPPCAFTRFATCPLPPAQNVLPIKVTAGEKNYDLH